MNDQELALNTFVWSNFTSLQRVEWFIYGARHRTCDKCNAPANSPCLNKSDMVRIARGAQIPQRYTRWPHEERVDWKRIVEGLKMRGYIT